MLLSVVETVKSFVEPWSTYCRDHQWIRTTLMFLHLGPLLLGGGLAVASDRAVLRALRSPGPGPAVTAELGHVHGAIIASLVAFFASGIGMALIDVEKYATSWIYWVKMGLVGLLLANGLWMLTVEKKLKLDAAATNKAWRTLRKVCVSSLALWVVITLFGVLLIEA